MATVAGDVHPTPAERAPVATTPHQVLAAAKPWNSATTLYIVRAVQDVAQRRSLSVLDTGCGDGRVMRFFDGFGHAMHGFDLPDREQVRRERMAPLLGDRFADRIRIMRDERRMPFGDAMSDVVCAKFDLLGASISAPVRTVARALRPLRGRVLDGLVRHGFMGVFRAAGPRPVDDRQRLLAWKS